MDERLKKYPVTERFRCIDTIGVPHPYMIGPRHVEEAANHWGGMLGKEAIRAAENKGAKCHICKGKLSYDQHETAVLVEVDDPKDEHSKELRQYLQSFADAIEKDGFAGFTFIRKKQ